MSDHDENDALLTEDQARDELGAKDYAEALESGELRRVRYGDGEFLLRGDVEKARDDRDPGKLAARVPRL